MLHVRTARRVPATVLALAALTSTTALAGCGSAAPSAAPTSNWTTASGGGFTTKLVVDKTTVSAGQPISSRLVIVNHTGRSVSYFSCLGDATLEVGIASAAVPFNPISGAIGCSTVLHPGSNVFNGAISTDYQGCGGSGVPACGSPPSIASLPAGSYHTTIVWQSVPSRVPHPAPIAITLTPSQQGILQGDTTPCRAGMGRGPLLVRQGKTTVDLQAVSEFKGRYRIELAPGRYTLSGSPMNAATRVWTVAVTAGRTTTAPTVTVACT
jgi:hypothetical protein